MKQLTCEMCGSKEMLKQDGVFVCQSCGTKYSVEEAKKMMVEVQGTVDVSGSTIKVDTSDELANLYQVARRAKNDNNDESATKYYELILIKDPTSWEAAFYTVYFKARACKIAEIISTAYQLSKSTQTVLQMIKDNVTNKDEQIEAYTEVANNVMSLASTLFYAAKNHYESIDRQIRDNYRNEWVTGATNAYSCLEKLGDKLDELFKEDTKANELSVEAWKKSLSFSDIVYSWAGGSPLKDITVRKIQKYDTSYITPTPQTSTATGGCYVATAVYGSYDCPQVWTLRRYRDYTLAETWCGRAFIRTYYAISPTLVKWFGHTNWFKNMWKGKLDRMVANLNAEGVEDTPYEDKNW